MTDALSSFAISFEDEFFRPVDFVQASAGELPLDVDAFTRYALQNGWRSDRRRARVAFGRGGGWEYHYTLAPVDVQNRLLASRQPDLQPLTVSIPANTSSRPLWDIFDRLPAAVKEEAARRLTAVQRVEDLSRGAIVRGAVVIVAQELGVSASTVFAWLATARAVARIDRLAALAPRRAGCTVTAECDPRAWDFIVTDHMRGEETAFEPCYRRMKEVAEREGWAPIPSCKTLQRRFRKEVPMAAAVYARKGKDALKRFYPAQKRDRSHFGPLHWVNIDGHKLDVFVRVPGIDKPVRMILIAIQDLGTGMYVGWNLDLSETVESTRLAIVDMVEKYGIPNHMTLDNGRAFASKEISGRQPTRFRFRVKEDEPFGVLTRLDIKVHWAKPKSGQSKPIERSFRDLCEEIAKHPVCAGAYTGNSPGNKPHNYGKAAVDLAVLEALVEQEIARHNERPGRKGLGMNGRSFLQVWNDKVEAGAMIRRATEVQRRMLLLSNDNVTVRKDQPAIHFYGNRYWAKEIPALAGRKVMVRYDPRQLQAPLAVYDLDDCFICSADCIDPTGFGDTEAARSHEKARGDYFKDTRKAAESASRFSVKELQRLTAVPGAEAARKARKPQAEPKVVALVAAGGGLRAPTREVTDLHAALSAGPAADVLPFRPLGTNE